MEQKKTKKAPTKTKKSDTSKTKVAKSSENKSTQKPKFDVDAFVFEVDISKIEDWVNGMCIELDDPDFEWPTYDEEYTLMVMINELDFYKKNGITKMFTSARENAIMGLYRR